MNITDFRNIGKKLMREIPLVKSSPDIQTSLGYGAAGDRTFPIDKIAEEIIISGLEALQEPLTIVSEEIGIVDINGGGVKVVIDPVDGSKNAVSGIPFYCASIASADGDTIGDLHLSYVINLVNGDEFWAERNSGACINGKRIHARRDDALYLLAYEAQVPQKDIPRIRYLIAASKKTRCLGATALDLAYLASGAISVFVAPSPSRSFDFAGGCLLVKESGGIITNTEGEEIDNILLDLERSTTLLASANQSLHRKAIELVSRGR